MVKIEQYDTVILKDGREAVIVEKFDAKTFLVDVGDSPEQIRPSLGVSTVVVSVSELLMIR